MKEFYMQRFSLLHKGFSNKPFARYAAHPSFSADYALSVEQKSDGYFLISHSLSENYWYAKQREHVTVNVTTYAIDEALYQSIGELFALATEQVAPVKKNSYGLDGTTYFFAKADAQGTVRIGETWSPQDGSRMDSLVNICDALYALSFGQGVSEREIEKNIRALIADMRKQSI